MRCFRTWKHFISMLLRIFHSRQTVSPACLLFWLKIFLQLQEPDAACMRLVTGGRDTLFAGEELCEWLKLIKAVRPVPELPIQCPPNFFLNGSLSRPGVISYSPCARSNSSYSGSVPCIPCQLHNQVQNSSARWQKKCSIKPHRVPSVV